jgi:hypothetical protein
MSGHVIIRNELRSLHRRGRGRKGVDPGNGSGVRENKTLHGSKYFLACDLMYDRYCQIPIICTKSD